MFNLLVFITEPPSNANPPGELPVTIEHQQDPNMTSNLTRNDANCDKTGTCYDGKPRYKIRLLYECLEIEAFYISFIVSVSVLCKDTRIAVQVRTNKPFNGRIYALGRSETCNIDVVNSDLFRLDLTMAGQDCNTQSVVSTLADLSKFIENCLSLFLQMIFFFRLECIQTRLSCNTTA